MKILILADHPAINTGYAKTCRELSKGFLKRGFQVFTLGFNVHGQEDIENYEGIIVLPSKVKEGANYGSKEILENYYNEYKFDFIIWHNDFYRLAYICEMSDEILKKSFFWLPEDNLNVDSWIPKIKEIEKYVRVVFISKFGYNLYKDIIKNSTCIYHSIDTEVFKKIEVERPDYLKNKFVISRVDRNQKARKNWLLWVVMALA